MNKQMNDVSDRLEDAFQVFNQFSEKLVGSYGDLESQIVQLTKELAKARSERLEQLVEKEILAKRLAGLLEVLPAGIVVLDSNGRVTQTNPVALEMLGQTDSNKLEGQQWEDIAKDMLLMNGSELQLKDGRWVNVSACPLKDDPGKIILISDISETHILQNMLNRQQRLSSLGEMIASLAHQVRTPLSSALLYLSTMNHVTSNESKKLYFAEKARERLLHLERIVDDMLIFARGDVSRSESINVDDLFGQLRKVLQQDSVRKQVSLDVNRNLKNIMLRANSDALLSAIQNLVDNAVDACADLAEENTKINICAFLNGDDLLEITVNDNGCGLSESTKERVLEPFYTTRSHGTGLGLAVVNATVSRFGGAIRIKSTEGKGCQIAITLPHVDMNALLPSRLHDMDTIQSAQSNAMHRQRPDKAKLKLIACQEV